MNDKLIWSNTMTADYLYELPEEELKDALEEFGYEREMLDSLNHAGLQDLVLSDDTLYGIDEEDFNAVILPEIERQTKDGIVLLSGMVGRWDGSATAGKAVAPEDLLYGDICKDCDNIAIYNDNGTLVWEGSHHDGTHRMALYALPEDEMGLRDFVATCMADAVEDELDYAEEADENEAIEVVKQALDADYINNYCDFSKVSEVCEPIHYEAAEAPVEESCDESCGYNDDLDEAKSKNPKNLAMELESIKADYEDFGPDGFYAVPFKRFERQYPEFTKSCIRTYLKELEILEPEEMENDDIFEEYWQTGELIVPEDWPILIDGATRLSTDRADKGYTWITLLKKYNRPFDEPEEENESLCEAVDTVVVPAILSEYGEYETSLYSEALEKYDFYQGDVILDNEYYEDLIDKMKNAGIKEGDKVLIKVESIDKDIEPYEVVDIIVDKNESLCEAESDEILVPATLIEYGEYETFLEGAGLQDYGYYQGDVILDNEYFEDLVNKMKNAGVEEGDEVLVKLKPSEDDYDEFDYEIDDIIVDTTESLEESKEFNPEDYNPDGTLKDEKELKEDLVDEIMTAIQQPEEVNVATIEPAPQVDCTMQTATNVMNTYQCANKWLDIVKEIVYTNLGCVFFSSYIHDLAHTMPVRFDKFGDILHTVNMRIPYPETPYIPNEPTSIDEVFGSLFMCLDNIKIALNEFIKCTDETAHGMACAAETLLNDIESEYPAIFRMQQEWQNSNGDMATFDKYIGQYVEHKDELV